jgi:hypothetical protein
MPALPQFDYIFAIATLFAFLDAWNIGMFSIFSYTSTLREVYPRYTISSIQYSAKVTALYLMI